MKLIAPYINLLSLYRQYRLLWLSYFTSLLGDWFNFIASAALVATLSQSGLAVGGIFIARRIPPLIFGPIAGVVADHFDRRTILIVCDMLRFFIVLGFLWVQTAADIWLVYVLTFLQLSVSTFFGPARSALVPSLVVKEDLVTANALDGSTWSATLGFGAALGGLATALFGVKIAFILDAFTFLVSAWFIYSIYILPKQKNKPEEKEGVGLTAIANGFNYLKGHPHILAIALVKGVAALSFGGADVVQVEFAENIFPTGGDGSATLGLIYAVIGLGTGIVPLVASQYVQLNRVLMRWVIGISFGLMAIGFLGTAWAPSLGILLLMTGVRAAGSGTAWAFSSALMQMDIPRQFLGRAFAFDGAMFVLAAIISTIGVSIAFDTFAFEARDVALGLAIVALLTWGGWQVYHKRYVATLDSKHLHLT